MRILILEDNLLWTARLQKSASALGHEPVVSAVIPEGDFDAAIVNLGSQTIDPESSVKELHRRGVVVAAHAGHKEKELHSLGTQMGCDVLATNGELTWKLEAILKKVEEIGNISR